MNTMRRAQAVTAALLGAVGLMLSSCASSRLKTEDPTHGNPSLDCADWTATRTAFFGDVFERSAFVDVPSAQWLELYAMELCLAGAVPLDRVAADELLRCTWVSAWEPTKVEWVARNGTRCEFIQRSVTASDAGMLKPVVSEEVRLWEGRDCEGLLHRVRLDVVDGPGASELPPNAGMQDGDHLFYESKSDDRVVRGRVALPRMTEPTGAVRACLEIHAALDAAALPFRRAP